MFNNILVPLNRTKFDEDAVNTAITLAKKCNAAITLIHVFEILPLFKKDREIEYRNLKDKIDDYMKPIQGNIEKEKISAKSVLKTGQPAFVICKYIEENNIDLVVMPVYDRDKATIYVGTLAERLLKHSPKPVLFVREASKDILWGRFILVVDDEPDILDTVEEQLSMCIVHKAKTKEMALELIVKNRYDIAILDIMGVDGFKILEETVKNYIPTVMLTAHALTKESLNRAAKLGATSFLPKDKMTELDTFLVDVIKNDGRPAWKKLFERLSSYFNEKLALTPEEEKAILSDYDRDI